MAVDCLEIGHSDTLVEVGQSSFYEGDWQEARLCFQLLQDQKPKDPAGYFLESMIPFWEYYFVTHDSDLADQFFELSEEAIERAEVKLQMDPDDSGAIAMLSGLYGYRSMVASEEGAIREAFRSGRKGYEYTKQLMELESDNSPEIHIGRGMYHYMAGSVPGSLRWLARLFGLHGDKQTGVDYLEEAAESNSYTRLDARLILSVIYKREGLEESALHHLNELLSSYEENRIFLLLKADLLVELGRTGEATRLYDLLIERADEHWVRLSAEIRERNRKIEENPS
ncbi:MAG: tetratricopeptide repeat protein [Bacteroidota bacterium]